MTKEAAGRAERNWDEISPRYEKVDINQAFRLTEEYLRKFLETPEVSRAFEILETRLDGRYAEFTFLGFEKQERSGMKLPYHNIEHAEVVMMNSIFLAVLDTLARQEPINQKELFLLAVKAAHHDIGATVVYARNEDAGAEIAGETLAQFGHSKDDIDNVKAGILSTRPDFQGGFRQAITESTSTYDEYLCDADVSNFGGSDFFEKSYAILVESKTIAGKPIPMDGSTEMVDNNNFVLQMITDHRWNTDVAFYLYEKQKQENIRLLRQQLSL